MLEFARDGHYLEEIIKKSKQLIGTCLVLDGVDKLLKSLSVEANLVNCGQRIIQVENPICTEDGSLELCFHGSFLPIPSYDLFKRKPEKVEGNSGENMQSTENSDDYVVIDKKLSETK